MGFVCFESILFIMTVLLLCIIITLMPSTHSLTMKMILRDSCWWITLHQESNFNRKIRVFVDLDEARALHMMSSTTTSDMISSNSTRPNFVRPKLRKLQSTLLAIKVHIGTQPYKTCMMVDTGSDFTWVQCQKCTQCFEIVGGPFDDEASHTFRLVNRNDPICDT